MTADVTREPTGGQELREAIVRGLARAHGASYVEWADAVLALPELAALVADAERVQRVRELAERWDADAARTDDAEPVSSDGLTRMILAARFLRMNAADLRRALDGDL